jgi:glycosyl hydrolase family 16
MPTNTETDRPFRESFDNGIGALSHNWAGSVDQSVRGEITLAGYTSTMEFPGGRSAGHGYGTYTVNAKIEGDEPGPVVLLWPGDDRWPGQEIDIVEVTPDGSGRQYGTVHWDGGGYDSYETRIFDGVRDGVFHDYQVVWAPGRITFRVDGVEKGTITSNVPRDFDAGGMNNVFGLMNTSPNTSLTVRSVDYDPLGGGGSGGGGNGGGGGDPAPGGGGSGTPPASGGGGGGGPVDWNAIAAQVMANFEATGSWSAGGGSTTPREEPAAPEAPAPSPEPVADGPVDWNAIAAQVTANFASSGSWHL